MGSPGLLSNVVNSCRIGICLRCLSPIPQEIQEEYPAVSSSGMRSKHSKHATEFCQTMHRCIREVLTEEIRIVSIDAIRCRSMLNLDVDLRNIQEIENETPHIIIIYYNHSTLGGKHGKTMKNIWKLHMLPRQCELGRLGSFTRPKGCFGQGRGSTLKLQGHQPICHIFAMDCHEQFGWDGGNMNSNSYGNLCQSWLASHDFLLCSISWCHNECVRSSTVTVTSWDHPGIETHGDLVRHLHFRILGNPHKNIMFISLIYWAMDD